MYLAVAAALDRDAHADLETGLIPVTIPEMLRMLRGTVIQPPRRDHVHRQHWSRWRRRHQYRASQAHRRWNAYADATPCLQRTTAAVTDGTHHAGSILRAIARTIPRPTTANAT